MRLSEKVSRLRAGRSYAEVARAAGCSPPAIRDIESGKTANPRADLILGLGRHFAVPLEWLLDAAAEWPPPPLRREDKLLAAVRRALRPFTPAEGFFGEELDVLQRLAAVHPTCRGSIFRALGAIVDVFWEGGELGAEAEASKQPDSPAEAGAVTGDAGSGRASEEDRAGAILDAAVPPRGRSGGGRASRKGADGA